MTVWPLLFVAGSVGFMAGVVFICAWFVKNTGDIWQITSPAGHTYYVWDIREVEAALRVDGMLAVHRMRVIV